MTTRWPAAVAAGLLLAACSSAKPSTPQPKASATQVVAGAPTATLTTQVIGRLGAVLVDAKGQTLYADSDEAACDAICRRSWPLLSAPAPAVGGAAQAGLVSVTTVGGTQVVAYAGHPLHRYVGDQSPGQAAGQGIQGTWHCVTATGTPAAGYP